MYNGVYMPPLLPYPGIPQGVLYLPTVPGYTSGWYILQGGVHASHGRYTPQGGVHASHGGYTSGVVYLRVCTPLIPQGVVYLRVYPSNLRVVYLRVYLPIPVSLLG